MIVLAGETRPVPTDLKPVEQGLLRQTGGAAVAFSGRAATALMQAYRIADTQRADVRRPEVIVPAMMCATAANTALLAGLTPRFADVDPCTGLITLESVCERANKHTIAVVVVHLLGHTVDVTPLINWCDEHGITLIEDVAQATGARLPDGRYAGSAGDLTVYSFNRTKILESGGGAIVANTPGMAAQLERVLQTDPLPQPPDPAVRRRLGQSYRDLHHALAGLMRLRRLPPEQASAAFLRARPAYADLYQQPFDTASTLGEDWAGLGDALARRRQKAGRYSQRLAGGPWTLLEGYRTSGVCWRFSLLIDTPDQQDPFSEAVRRDGFHVSNLYWPVNQFFHPADACPGADEFGRRVVNLWVDDSVTLDDVDRCCDSLWRHAHLLQDADPESVS